MAVTPSQVEDVFDTELDSDSLNFWISTATELVDEIKESSYPVSKDRLIVLVACHYASVQEPRIRGGSEAGVNVQLSGDTGMKWESTQYGQTAIQLAPTLRDQTSRSFEFYSV